MLARHLRVESAQPRHVPTGPPQAGDMTLLHRIRNLGKNDGNRVRHLSGGVQRLCPRSHEHVDLKGQELGREARKTLDLSAGRPEIDLDVSAFDVTVLAHSLPEGLLALRKLDNSQIAHARDFLRWLRDAQAKRRKRERTAREKESAARRHSITSFARTSIDWGIVRPRILAVLRLMPR